MQLEHDSWSIYRIALPLNLRLWKSFVVKSCFEPDRQGLLYFLTFQTEKSVTYMSKCKPTRITGSSVSSTLCLLQQETGVGKECIPYSLGGDFHYEGFENWIRERLSIEIAQMAFPTTPSIYSLGRNRTYDDYSTMTKMHGSTNLKLLQNFGKGSPVKIPEKRKKSGTKDNCHQSTFTGYRIFPIPLTSCSREKASSKPLKRPPAPALPVLICRLQSRATKHQTVGQSNDSAATKSKRNGSESVQQSITLNWIDHRKGKSTVQGNKDPIARKLIRLRRPKGPSSREGCRQFLEKKD